MKLVGLGVTLLWSHCFQPWVSLHKVMLNTTSTVADPIWQVPKDERNRVPDLITGTSGAAEHLDKSYFVRSGSEAHRFFKVGKV
jgi:hypothetical protein